MSISKSFLTLVFLLTASKAMAMFMIDPHRLLFDHEQESMRVKVTNTATYKKIYRPSFLRYVQKSDGSFKTVKSQKGTTFAQDFLKVEPKEIALDPQESDYFEVSFKDEGADIKDGEYLSYLAVLEKEHPDFIQPDIINGQWVIKSEYRLAIPTVVRQGKLTVEADLKKAKLIQNKKKEAQLKISLTRIGNKSIRGNVEIFDGEDRIGILNGIAVYTGLKNRKLEIPLNRQVGTKENIKHVPLTKKELKGKEVKVKFTGNVEDEIPLEVIRYFKL